MKPCPVVIAHAAHDHPNIGHCPGIRQRDIMRQVEARKTDAFHLSNNLSNRLGMVVSVQMVRRNLKLWQTVYDKLTEVNE